MFLLIETCSINSPDLSLGGKNSEYLSLGQFQQQLVQNGTAVGIVGQYREGLYIYPADQQMADGISVLGNAAHFASLGFSNGISPLTFSIC